jgi:hypothetical protein
MITYSSKLSNCRTILDSLGESFARQYWHHLLGFCGWNRLSHFPVEAIRKGWYSHKFKGPGLRYEVGVCIQTGDLVWINGPFPCGAWPDIKIFRQDLIGCLTGGEKVEADKGYRGEAHYIKTPRNDVDTIVRSRHETVNKRFKQWGCLNKLFRHQPSKHQSVFGAVAVLTQLAIENGEPLFGVFYNDTSN